MEGVSCSSNPTASWNSMPSIWIRKFNAEIPPMSLDFQCHLLVMPLILKLSWSVSSHSFLAEDFFKRPGWCLCRYSMADTARTASSCSSPYQGIKAAPHGAASPGQYAPTEIPSCQNARKRQSAGRWGVSIAGCG